MSATIRPIGLLRPLCKNIAPGSEAISVAAGQRLRTVCEELGLPLDLVALFVVNGRRETADYVLQAGDDVKLVALVGGG